MRWSSRAAWPETCTPLSLAVDHLGAGLEQAVDGVHDADFVARHRPGRDHHRVARLQRDLRMIVERHARQRRERLALAARGEDEQLLGRGSHRCR